MTVGARAPEWRTVVVRDRHTRRLVEVSLVGEEDPIDPGDPGTAYVFKQGEEVPADHPAVLDAPGALAPVED